VQITDRVLKDILKKFGSKNQIMVCIEELNELACVLAKFPRYDTDKNAVTEMKDKVLDEYADVIIILHHIKNIFQLEDTEVMDRLNKKLKRIKRWVDNPETKMSITIKDREV